MKPLGFRIVRTPYAPASGLAGEMVQKVRDDGRVGLAVGDEEALWDALQDTHERLIHCAKSLKEATEARLAAEEERDELRRQLERKGKR